MSDDLERAESLVWALRAFADSLQAHIAAVDTGDVDIPAHTAAIAGIWFERVAPGLLALAAGELFDGAGELLDRLGDAPLEIGLGIVAGRVGVLGSRLRGSHGVAIGHDETSLQVAGSEAATSDAVARTLEGTTDAEPSGGDGESAAVATTTAALAEGGEQR